MTAAILGPSSIQYDERKVYPWPQYLLSASCSYIFVTSQAMVKGMGITENTEICKFSDFPKPAWAAMWTTEYRAVQI